MLYTCIQPVAAMTLAEAANEVAAQWRNQSDQTQSAMGPMIEKQSVALQSRDCTSIVL